MTHQRLTTRQIEKLTGYYRECSHPDKSQRLELSLELNLKPETIKYWFQNRRHICKTQSERSSNILLREEIQQLRLENTMLKEQMANFLSKNKANQLDSIGSVNGQHFLELPASQAMEPPLLSETDIHQLFETASSAVEELKRLFVTDATLWDRCPYGGTCTINQESYAKFSLAKRHVRSLIASVESSTDITEVPIGATNLIGMFLDTEKRKELFPTIVNKTNTIHKLGSDLPIQENCNVLQLIWEQLHILSPLVPPREFMVIRCCQEIENGLWIIADVSYDSGSFCQVNGACWKRPSGCLIQALPNGHSKVIWIEHVEVGDNSDIDHMCVELLCGGFGYGAKRWIVTLERMCRRMALTYILPIPITDWSGLTMTEEGRRSVMKLGERMSKNFNEVLIMSNKIDIPQPSTAVVRFSTRISNEAGQPLGQVVIAASTLAIPLNPLQVFNCIRNMETRPQWDVLSHRKVVSEIACIYTGSNVTDCVTILQPTKIENSSMIIGQSDMCMLQDCYMDALGGMLVYAAMDTDVMKKAVSGEVDPSSIPILPSGFIISRNGQEGGTILTVASQVLIPCQTIKLNETVNEMNNLISYTIENVKLLLNCPQC